MWNEKYSLYPYQRGAAMRMLTQNILLAYEMGCLSGDTELMINRGGKSKRMRIDHVVRMFNGGTASNMKWDLSIPTMVARAEGSVSRLVQVVNAWESGVKQTYTVTTDSGRTIRATDEHPFLTTEGWSRLDELVPGTQVLVNIGRSTKGRTAPKRYYAQTFGMDNHPYRSWWASKYWAVPTHRLVAEAAHNGVSLEVLVDKIRAGDTSSLEFFDPATHAVHHIDHDHLNNDPSNLEVLTHTEHHRRHADEGKTESVLERIGAETVVSVEPYGEEMTYDIEVADDPHCFQANGFVVHNTGKTPTTLWAMEALRKDMPLSHITVVVPSSLKFQWRSEIQKFTDQDCIVIDGNPTQREHQYQRVLNERPGYMVLSYDSIVRDWKRIQTLELYGGAMVLDEATAIKSFTTKRSKHLKKIAKKYSVRIALTGTPMENGKLEELFSIMEWVDRSILGSWPKFEERYIRRNQMGWIEGYKNVGHLNRHLNRTNSVARATHAEPEVAKYLPKVVERPTLVVPLPLKDRTIVEEIGSRILSDLDEFVGRFSSLDIEEMQRMNWDHPDGRMMAKITALRQFLSYPASLMLSDNKFVDQLLDDGVLRTPSMIGVNSKMQRLFDYLKDFLDENPDNKAVVFTSFVHTAERIHSEYPDAALLTGRMNAHQRQHHIDKFKSDPQCRLFVSTDAGGFGLDLPQGNLLINYDLPWSPGVLAQRSARIKRASSTWPYVVIQNMVTEGTIEERMMQMLEYKMAHADAVIDGEGVSDAGEVVADLDSLRKFLAGSGFANAS